MDTTVGKLISNRKMFKPNLKLIKFNNRGFPILDDQRPFIPIAFLNIRICNFTFLSYSLIFQFLNYCFQFWELYNSYVLYNLIQTTMFQDEWQVPALSLIFFILFSGNFITTYMVIRKKYKERVVKNFDFLYKYTNWIKLRSPSEKTEKKLQNFFSTTAKFFAVVVE